MVSASTQCPQCGAPAPFRAATLSLTCEYCGSTIVRAGVDVKLVGKISALVDTGSPIILGARGTHQGLGFEIIGRLQIRYARGTWNEWYVEFADGRDGWLADAQGSFAVVSRQKGATFGRRGQKTAPRYEIMEPGKVIKVSGAPMMITDRRAARYRGSEGCLPFTVAEGQVFHSVDLRDNEDAFMTLDYGDGGENTNPQVFTGQAVTLPELGLRPLRRFEGWRA